MDNLVDVQKQSQRRFSCLHDYEVRGLVYVNYLVKTHALSRKKWLIVLFLKGPTANIIIIFIFSKYKSVRVGKRILFLILMHF